MKTVTPKFRTRNYHPVIAYSPGGVRVVRPNLSMTIQEIQRRFASGLALPDSMPESYSDVDWSNIERMNKFERADFAHALRLQIEEKKQQEALEFKEKRDKQVESEIQRLVDERVRKVTEGQLVPPSTPEALS